MFFEELFFKKLLQKRNLFYNFVVYYNKQTIINNLNFTTMTRQEMIFGNKNTNTEAEVETNCFCFSDREMPQILLLASAYTQTTFTVWCKHWKR